MIYYFTIYVCNPAIGDHLYEYEIECNSLEEAEIYYNQFEGKEVFERKEIYEVKDKILYIVKIDYSSGSIDPDIFVKAKYKSLDVKDFYPDFWKLFNSLKSE